MTKEEAQVALQFLARVELRGAEVPAFNRVCAALEVMSFAEAVEPQTPEQPVSDELA